jgi:hypothetical protein
MRSGGHGLTKFEADDCRPFRHVLAKRLAADLPLS